MEDLLTRDLEAHLEEVEWGLRLWSCLESYRWEEVVWLLEAGLPATLESWILMKDRSCRSQGP